MKALRGFWTNKPFFYKYVVKDIKVGVGGAAGAAVLYSRVEVALLYFRLRINMQHLLVSIIHLA